MKHVSIAVSVMLAAVAVAFATSVATAPGMPAAKEVYDLSEQASDIVEEVSPAAKSCCSMTDEHVRYQQLAQMAAAREEAAREAQEAQEWYYAQTYYESAAYVDYTPAYDDSDGISAEEFMWRGVVEDGEHFYTWYSQNVLPGGGLVELNDNGRHVEGGFVVDGDGYIAVASCDYEKGTIIDTPFGEAKVYDTGCLAPGQVDVYTAF